MTATKVLIVEDEGPIREMIAFHLSRAGFDTVEAADCRQARELLADERPDLALVDWMLPDMSGLELTRMLKRDAENEELFVIMLTAKAEERDKVSGLDSGADDYVTKPFSPRELIARINAVLRRSKTSSGGTITAGTLTMDTAGHRVASSDSEVTLGPTEYRLLKFLMTHPDRVYSRTQLLDRVWGANVYVEERTVDVHVRRLRKALTEYGARPIHSNRSRLGLPLLNSHRLMSGEQRKLVLSLLLLLGVGALIGWLYDRTTLGLLAASLAALAWQLKKLFAFERAIRRRDFDSLRYGDGIWAQIHSTLDFYRRRSQNNKKQYRRLLKEVRRSTKAIPDGGIVLNGDFEILTCNPAAQDLVGFNSKKDRGQRVDNILRDPKFAKYVRNGDFRDKDVEVMSPVREDSWLNCRIVPFGADQQLLLIRDVTDRIHLNKMRREFIANASHELRSPLTVISGYLDALVSDAELPASWHKPVAQMRSQADRMNKIVGELLELSRLEAAGSDLKSERVDVCSLMSAAANTYADARGVARIDVNCDSPTLLRGASTEIESVIANLLSNAVRHTPTAGVITLTWSVDREGGLLTVADTGEGIDQDDIPRLTERFFSRRQGSRSRGWRGRAGSRHRQACVGSSRC